MKKGRTKTNRIERMRNTNSTREKKPTLVARLEWIASHQLPVIEDTLRERLTGRVGAQVSGETERFVDGQVGLDVVHGSTGTLLFRNHVTTTTVKNTVNSTDGILRALDLHQVDGLLNGGGGRHERGVADATASGDDLSSTTMDSISVLCSGSAKEGGRGRHGIIAKLER